MNAGISSLGSAARLIVALLAVVWVCSSASGQCIICPVTGNAAFPVSPSTGDQQVPAISGDTVVWEDYRNEATTKGDIYGFDLRTLTEFPVCTAIGEQWLPSIDGRTVVWQDARNAPTVLTLFDLYSFDTVSRTEAPVSVSARTKWNPSIQGSRVVWEERISGSNYDIRSIVLGGGLPTTICAAANGQYEASVWGNTAVWQDFRSGTNDDIYAYDFTTGTEMPVCTASGDQIFPEIYGTRVVWEDYRSGSHIYMKDLATGVETKLTSVTSEKWQPVISDRYVVWQDKRNGNWDLYMYDLAAGIESPLIVCDSDQTFPRISGNKVAFQCGACATGEACQVYVTIIGEASYQDVPKISDARSAMDGTAVQLTGKVATRSFGGTFYVEEADRSSAIRVAWPASVTPGSLVTVKGLVATRDGEREIGAAMVENLGAGTIPRPIYVGLRDMSGLTWAGSPAWIGPNQSAPNIGLLVCVSGRVGDVGDGYFCLTDGSGDGMGSPLRVKVICGGLNKPEQGEMAWVVGVASLSPLGSELERAVRVQYQGDIVAY